MDNNQKYKWENVKQALSYVRKKLRNKLSKETLAESKEILEQCANENDVIAQYQLYALEYNKLVEESEPGSSLFWCQKAAEQGYAPAQYDLALHYLYGDLVTKDIYKSLLWMEKSADQDYAEAMHKLVSLYNVGSKIKRNEPRSLYWKSRLEGMSKDEAGSIIPLEPSMIQLEPQKTKEYLEQKSKYIDDIIAHNFKSVTQDKVINADINKSYIINAGPGTGKTYTIIKRINSLVMQGVESDAVQVLSFTNAVVKEIKTRLYKQSLNIDGNRSLRSVNVNTFHSLAYWFLKEANKNIEEDEWEKLDLDFKNMKYEDCLLKASELLEKIPDVIQGWQYVIIDEIQDINEGKASFVIKLIEACISQNVPFMLLGDTCQSIYDYLNDKNTGGCDTTTEEFYDAILELSNGKAEFVSFDNNHRQNEKLKTITKPIREVILDEEKGKYAEVVWDLSEQIKSIKIENIQEFINAHSLETICFLQRNNFNTKMLSKRLIQDNVEHKCVLNSDRNAYPAWIGYAFSEYYEDFIDGDTFIECISKNLDTANLNNVIKLWDDIQNWGGHRGNLCKFEQIIGVFQTHLFDKAISYNEDEPLISVSNIHRSKGLEYDIVLFDEEFVNNQAYKSSENMRMLYVAITRPKKELYFCNVKEEKYRIRYWREDGGKRSYVSEKIGTNNYRLKYIEIISEGENKDINPGISVYEDQKEMNQVQAVIRRIKKNDPVSLKYNKYKKQYEVLIELNNQVKSIGWMDPSFTKKVMRISRGKMPVRLDELYVDNIHTFIGSTKQAVEPFERILINNRSTYAKYRIWNYISFSGPAKCSYGD